MVLFTESAMELDEKQFGLTMDIYSHDIHSMLDMYTENCYLEETASTDDEKSNSTSGKKSVMQTIIEKLKSMIAKVGEIIDAFKASIEGKKNLTAEEYMGSETAKIQFAYDCEAIQKEVDMEYLEARKIVSSISSITKLPIEKVAAFCDKMDAKLHENKDKFFSDFLCISVFLVMYLKKDLFYLVIRSISLKTLRIVQRKFWMILKKQQILITMQNR